MEQVRLFSTGQVARLLKVPQYKLEYARRCQRLPTPQMVGKTHCYTSFDLVKIAQVLGVELPIFKDEEE